MSGASKLTNNELDQALEDQDESIDTSKNEEGSLIAENPALTQLKSDIARLEEQEEKLIMQSMFLDCIAEGSNIYNANISSLLGDIAFCLEQVGSPQGSVVKVQNSDAPITQAVYKIINQYTSAKQLRLLYEVFEVLKGRIEIECALVNNALESKKSLPVQDVSRRLSQYAYDAGKSVLASLGWGNVGESSSNLLPTVSSGQSVSEASIHSQSSEREEPLSEGKKEEDIQFSRFTSFKEAHLETIKLQLSEISVQIRICQIKAKLIEIKSNLNPYWAATKCKQIQVLIDKTDIKDLEEYVLEIESCLKINRWTWKEETNSLKVFREWLVESDIKRDDESMRSLEAKPKASSWGVSRFFCCFSSRSKVTQVVPTTDLDVSTARQSLSSLSSS